MMKDMPLNHPESNLFVPDAMAGDTAIARTTQLAIGAHQDDLEIMAYSAIEACYQKSDAWFGGIVVTDGSGSAREGAYADYSDEDMRRVRYREQRKAAAVGEYSFVAQLGYPSREVRAGAGPVVEDIKNLIERAAPEVVYVHNPCDKHPTHIGTLLRTLEALRQLPPERRPKALYGVEVWRDLDWMDDGEKVVLRTDRRPNLAQALVGIFDSQITGGKRYDLAAPGRRLANATFFEAHAVDAVESACFAMDLTSLLEDDGLKLSALAGRHLDRLKEVVMNALQGK